MARSVFSRRVPQPEEAPPRGSASAPELQEFVRLYMQVDEESRRVLRQLVRRSSTKPPQDQVLH
jgi:hypothetical protein